MIYNKLNTINASSLGLGSMNLINVEEMVDCAILHGINYFEVATFYLNNNCQLLVSTALSKYDRATYYLCDKLCLQTLNLSNITYEELVKVFNDQLTACNTDYFDVYLLQALNRYTIDILKNNDVIFKFFSDLIKNGKIKLFGFSFHDDIVILNELLTLFNWDVVQILISFYDWYYGNAKLLYKRLTDLHIPIIAMKPNHGTILIDKLSRSELNYFNGKFLHTIYELNLIFLQLLSNIKIILTGASTIEQLSKNIDCINSKFIFSEYDRQIYMKLFSLCNTKLTINCTNCKYCELVCPVNIKISDLFTAVNTQDKLTLLKYRNNVNSWYNCMNCKLCEKICTLQINITDIFKSTLNNII